MSAWAVVRHFNISLGTIENMLAFSAPLGYRRDVPIKCPKLDGFTEIIDAWLECVFREFWASISPCLGHAFHGILVRHFRGCGQAGRRCFARPASCAMHVLSPT